ncbi:MULTISPECIES: RNA-guided endonuclease InsQ/TnpB family protein [Gammaproteobacteria]|uniref:Cas12f1-like TNB domain-containing protein n=1 Tax=Halomonas cibimaris TaxID=657012 RepID=A0ABP7LHT5_9GAMM|nr:MULTISPECIES: RNA-guided endonuclease TnpB family protein [Gammaproteobacteria]
MTLSRTVTGKHYAALLFETGQDAPERLQDLDASSVVGLDMGLSHLAIDSSGRKTANPRFLKQAQKNLKRKQQVKNMMKNARLARHIGDASWHALIAKLAYKAEEKGKHLVKLDPRFPSSKTCHACHHKMDAMLLNVRLWACPACHTRHDRDINAALNIKHQGIVQLKAAGLSVSVQ